MSKTVFVSVTKPLTLQNYGSEIKSCISKALVYNGVEKLGAQFCQSYVNADWRDVDREMLVRLLVCLVRVGNPVKRKRFSEAWW